MPDPRRGIGFELGDVTVRYGGVVALSGLALRVKAGEAVALVGPSGAGKTSVLRLLTGAVGATSGEVRVDGRDPNTAPAAELRRLRSRIGFVYQDLRLVPNLRVSQNVLSGRLGRLNWWQSLRLFWRPPDAEMVRVHELLDQVGVADRMFQRVDRLSGGQAQRVAIARALYQDPGILLADEPVASVDPARAAALLELLTSICRREQLTLVVSLHDPALARRFFPRLVGLREGRIAFDAMAGEISDSRLAELYALEAGDEL